ncbi:MAG: sulfite exporter TauE/SafE family protein [Chloroflexi bacterium]|nr:sulfite exporter TauE/SafE family protein [Chloroflexota bacterium]
MELSLFSIIALGFILGIKHATDTDHVVAVSTIVSEYRNPLKAGMVGVSWALGHGFTLYIIGIGVLLLRLTIPEGLAHWMEFAVGIWLVVLGAWILKDLFFNLVLNKLHLHAHSHSSGATHSHIHPADTGHEHQHVPSLVLRPRSIVTGIIHGLAGSAALMLLVLASIRSPWEGLLYILIFDLGTILGMLAISTIISLPFTFTARRFSHLNDGIKVLASVVSISLGILIMVELGLPLAT